MRKVYQPADPSNGAPLQSPRSLALANDPSLNFRSVGPLDRFPPVARSFDQQLFQSQLELTGQKGFVGSHEMGTPSQRGSYDYAFEKKAYPTRSYIQVLGQPNPTEGLITPIKQSVQTISGSNLANGRFSRSENPVKTPADLAEKVKLGENVTSATDLNPNAKPFAQKQSSESKNGLSVTTQQQQFVEFALPGVGTYRGEVLNGEMSGIGQIVGANGETIYEGDLLSIQYHGLGILYNREPKEQARTELLSVLHNKQMLYTREELPFDTDPATNEQNSTAKEGSPALEIQLGIDLESAGYTWTRYEGLFNSGVKEGTGYLYFSNGSVYFGEFDRDKPNGWGSLLSASGDRISGVWKDGQLVQGL